MIGFGEEPNLNSREGMQRGVRSDARQISLYIYGVRSTQGTSFASKMYMYTIKINKYNTEVIKK